MNAYDLIMALVDEGNIDADLEKLLALACKFIDKAVLDHSLFEEFLIEEIPFYVDDEEEEE